MAGRPAGAPGRREAAPAVPGRRPRRAARPTAPPRSARATRPSASARAHPADRRERPRSSSITGGSTSAMPAHPCRSRVGQAVLVGVLGVALAAHPRRRGAVGATPAGEPIARRPRAAAPTPRGRRADGACDRHRRPDTRRRAAPSATRRAPSRHADAGVPRPAVTAAPSADARPTSGADLQGQGRRHPVGDRGRFGTTVQRPARPQRHHGSVERSRSARS